MCIRDRLSLDSFMMPSDLPDEVSQLSAMIQDSKEFFGSRDWYRQRGIPFRRGYLLHGQSGGGKTFFVRLLAGLMGAPVYILDIGSNSNLTNETLPAVIQQVGSNSVVLLKHIDKFVANRSMAGVSKHLTFSGLLNVIDGALGHSKGLLMILTTNSFSRLCRDTKSADALLRPGRVSLSSFVGRPSPAQLTECFCRMFGQQGAPSPAVTAQAEAFVSALRDRFPPQPAATWRSPFSFAEIKGLLMKPQVQNDPNSASDPQVLEQFVQQIRVTMRGNALKLLDNQVKALKKELRRGVDTENDRSERDRSCADSQAAVDHVLNDVVIGLEEAPDELLSKRIGTVDGLRERIENGEVDNTPIEKKEVKCPKCGTLMQKYAMPGNYCDTPDCGGSPAFRCPNHNCDFDVCSSCHAALSEDS
eukprot:TRINITY_DN28258_c0_g1_i1.p1 TRINITY_DN28258_c0_g1~~TRINITY_DN28258_c0_g1_i1.p1  ORF type:complete len:417 (-),score=108.55 TRINITY_DN28258_c0_g1_i1:130-1380(-)